MSLFVHEVSSKLLYSLQTSLLSDFVITLNDVSIPCHNAIVSQECGRLAPLIQKGFSEFTIDVWEEASPNEFKLFVQVLYGKPCTFSHQNALAFFLLSKTLGCDEIAIVCNNVIKSGNSCKYSIPFEEILENLKVDVLKDHQIIFYDFSLKIHKFFFASLSPYFKAKFTKHWLDSNDTTSDFSKLLQVSPSSFSNFFTSFYDGKLEVNLENAFEYSHLAWYFQLSELEKFVEDFILNSKAEYQWVTSLVLKAINCEDYRFIKIISTKISEIQDLSNCDPIPVHPLFFQNLTSNIDVSWLLRCLVFSYVNYSEDNVWTPQSLEKSFETIKFDTLPIDKIYQIIEPLFSMSDLFDSLSSFSLSIFSKFTSQVPLNWFTWFIVESDLKKEFNLISQVSPLLYEIITPEIINQVPITSFNSETVHLFAINSKKEHLVIWLINCLIELWSTSQLNVEDFSRILMGFDLSETRFQLVYSALSRLFSDEILKPILCEFVTFNLVSRLVEENKKTVGEKDNVITKLEAEVTNLTNQLTDQEPIIRQHQREVEERRIAEQQRQEERRIAEQQRQEERRRLAEMERTRPKFLAFNKGSNITLSDNDLVATRTSGDYWANSFVAIQHPVKGKVVLTLLKFDGDFDTLIGFFNGYYAHASNCYHYTHSLNVCRDDTQFYISYPHTSGPLNSSIISRKQQVIIEFNNKQVTFSVPSVGYSHTVSWPISYVFGLAMRHRNTSWKLSSS
ncbi:hypothetical protein RCL1_008002 [Eukaryota sp. TZLM3-RCL]